MKCFIDHEKISKIFTKEKIIRDLFAYEEMSLDNSEMQIIAVDHNDAEIECIINRMDSFSLAKVITVKSYTGAISMPYTIEVHIEQRIKYPLQDVCKVEVKMSYNDTFNLVTLNYYTL